MISFIIETITTKAITIRIIRPSSHPYSGSSINPKVKEIIAETKRILITGSFTVCLIINQMGMF